MDSIFKSGDTNCCLHSGEACILHLGLPPLNTNKSIHIIPSPQGALHELWVQLLAQT